MQNENEEAAFNVWEDSDESSSIGESDDDLVPLCDPTEVEEDSEQEIAYLTDFIPLLHSEEYEKVLLALKQLSHRIREKSPELVALSRELASVVLYLDNRFNLDNFNKFKREILVSLAVESAYQVVPYLHQEFHGARTMVGTRLQILDVLVSSAVELSALERNIVNDEQEEDPIKLVGKVLKRWGVRKRNLETKASVNRFHSLSSLFILPLLHRNKTEGKKRAVFETEPLLLARCILAIAVMLECNKHGRSLIYREYLSFFLQLQTLKHLHVRFWIYFTGQKRQRMLRYVFT